MEGIPQEVLIVGGLVLVGLAVLIVARYAKQILLFLLIVGGVLALGAIAWAMLQQPSTPASTEGSGAGGTLHDVADIARVFTKSEPQPTYTAPTSSGGGFVAGVLVALLIVALCVAGYFGLRWKLAEWGGASPQRKRKRRKAQQSPAPVVYVVQQQQDLDALADLWDLEGLTEWTQENEIF